MAPVFLAFYGSVKPDLKPQMWAINLRLRDEGAT